ncbi:MAG: glycosyltransferase [Planctomycetes bacterium]|nr:glycosyltransferase [Planctomycetota bacterium]
MKVLHVIYGISPRFGGPSRIILDLCRALETIGCETEIATTDADVEGNIDLPKNRPFVRDGTKLWCFPCPAFRKYGFSPELTAWLNRRVRQYDILHLHSFFTYPNLPAVLSSLRHHVPYIIRPTGHLDPWSLRRHSWRKWIFYGVFGRTMLRQAGAIHVTSTLEQRALQYMGFVDKCRVIPIGVEIHGTPERPSQLRHSRRPLRTLFLSRLDPKKGLPILLHAVRRLRDRGIETELFVAGSGPFSYLEEMKNLSQRLSIEQWVRFLGFVQGDEKRQCFWDADLFVLPSYDENFGVAVAEAMASGLPVIVTDRVGLAPDISEAGAGIVCPTSSIKELVDSMQLLLSNENLRRQMGCRARELVEKHLAWPQVAQRLMELYKAVIKTGSGGGRRVSR